MNGYFEIANVNFRDASGDAVAGLFGDTRPAPRNDAELVVPGIPDTAPADPNYITGVALAFVEFPAPGMYYMGVNRDDGFRLTVATTEGGRDLMAGPNVQEVGVFNGGGGTDANNVQPNGFTAVYVPQAGVWPFRRLWWGGTGDDNVEWFQTNEQLPIGLINDSITTTTLRAFRSRSAQPTRKLRVRSAELAPPGGVWPLGDLAVEFTYSAGTPVTHTWADPMREPAHAGIGSSADRGSQAILQLHVWNHRHGPQPF